MKCLQKSSVCSRFLLLGVMVFVVTLTVPSNVCLAQALNWQQMPAVELSEYIARQKQQDFKEVPKDLLVHHARRLYLSNTAYLDSADPSEWIPLAQEVAGFFDAGQKQSLYEMLDQRVFQNEAVFRGLDVWTAWELRHVSQELGVPKYRIYAWMYDWLTTSDRWKQDATLGEVNVLLDWAMTVQNQAGHDTTAVLEDIYGYIRDKAMNDPTWLNGEGTFWMSKMVQRIEDKVTDEQRQRVLGSIKTALVDDRDSFLSHDASAIGRLREMAESFGAPKQTRDGWVLDWFTQSDEWKRSNATDLNKVYTWLDGLDASPDADAAMGELGRFSAEKLVDAPESYSNQRYFKSLSVLLKTPEHKAYLASLLVDGQGEPRQDVARALSRVYADTDDVDRWRAFIDEQIDATGLASDTRAAWTQVRDEAESTYSTVDLLE